MHPYKRTVRVNDLLREEIAEIIMHKLKDPRVGFITVTGVKTSDDLRNANVYVSVLEDSKRDETMGILKASARFIRSELSGRISMKFVPQLFFRLDESIEYGAKIDKILNEIKSREDSGDKEDEGSV
ncbi:MAG: 30S ribosome-binding factor RbfA [Nitrospirae bacterium]|nr:30S ribosome-binding factor RbfA [Nitrospirota bacterium]MBI4838563.1 30S ribosome-binding factor RbfA [Nitrospirota bacterium]